jgi:thiamine-phosphate pyrophosphorylase
VPRLEGLYVLIDPTACEGRDPFDVAHAALDGGASIIQWRDKRRDKGVQLPAAREIYDLCLAHDAVFIVNDHVDLALAIAAAQGPGGTPPSRLHQGAIGVHVGQSDLPLADVRRIVPEGFVIGVSTNNPDEALAAQAGGAGYVAVGDIFGTASKADTRPASVERLAEVRAAVRIPVVAIGGINLDNVAEVIAAGANAAAVMSAVCAATDPSAAARRLVQAIEAARRERRA